MKKIALLIIASILIGSCSLLNTNKFHNKTTVDFELVSNDGKYPVLAGLIDEKTLANQYPFNCEPCQKTQQWYEPEYNLYPVDTTVLTNIDTQDLEVIIILGTWCPDSRREVPRFMKIHDAVFPQVPVTMYAVDRNKKANKYTGKIQKYNFTRIPTFIFLRDKKEIGRIVESPQESLEEDIAKIIKNK